MTYLQEGTIVRRVYLYGALADCFSKEPIELSANNIEEINLAFRSIFKGWRNYLRENASFAFVLTEDNKTNPRHISPEFPNTRFGSATEIHILPELEGNWAAAIIAIGEIAWTQIAINMLVSFAINAALSAISQALAPSPDTGAGSSNVAKQESFIYNGAINSVQQGGPVPVVYGYFLVGSTVVSTSVDVEQLLTTPAKSAPPNNGGGTVQPMYPPAVDWQWAGK